MHGEKEQDRRTARRLYCMVESAMCVIHCQFTAVFVGFGCRLSNEGSRSFTCKSTVIRVSEPSSYHSSPVLLSPVMLSMPHQIRIAMASKGQMNLRNQQHIHRSRLSSFSQVQTLKRFVVNFSLRPFTNTFPSRLNLVPFSFFGGGGIPFPP